MEVLDPIIPRAKCKKLLKDIRKLLFISALLSRFTEHLLTMVSGSHVKPTRLPELPYLVFKPTTHSQFHLTQLNIINKFGQAMAAINPTRRVEGPPLLSLYISEYYQPQAWKGSYYPNVIKKPKTPNEC
ncbi:uncharacterized protein Aud_002059 [Aspergillus udagawae]|uniref:Uncharacterized protein n=1 Tax=Aspergillus udagawae TaxID=91492 RepID=A0A8E0R243_9EURO|nr:uncharacterized protein Aud_002059 [Aspergillus udagawae]GIC94730.1 hypothetical protein Aud_002059 [Aspergillus udagawae]